MRGYGEKAVMVIAAVAVIYLLHWGAPFFIPLLVALLIAYALAPVTDALTRLVRYRALSATLVVGAVLALMGTAAWAWSDDVQQLWERVPDAARSISGSMKKMASKTPSSPVAEVKKAAADIESIAQTGRAAPPAPPPAAAASTISFWGLVWTGGKGVAIVLSQIVAVMFLVFFMLASGDLFKRKLVKIYGNTLSEKKITVEMIDEIDLQIRRYLMVVLVSNVLVGVGTWFVFRLMDVNYAGLWGLGSAILHTAPYFGPALIAAAAFVAGFLQFQDWSTAMMVSGMSILVATLVGSVFATWLASRQTQMNITATFIGLLFFGWIWGLWGVLLAIPVMAIVKTVCDTKEEWKPVSELLSK
jgi:predicted PurR-regulated permease PerM